MTPTGRRSGPTLTKNSAAYSISITPWRQVSAGQNAACAPCPGFPLAFGAWPPGLLNRSHYFRKCQACHTRKLGTASPAAIPRGGGGLCVCASQGGGPWGGLGGIARYCQSSADAVLIYKKPGRWSQLLNLQTNPQVTVLINTSSWPINPERGCPAFAILFKKGFNHSPNSQFS